MCFEEIERVAKRNQDSLVRHDVLAVLGDFCPFFGQRLRLPGLVDDARDKLYFSML